METEIKSTVAAVSSWGMFGISLTQLNELLTTISLILTVIVTAITIGMWLVKLARWLRG